MPKKSKFFSLLFLVIGLFLFFPFSAKAANLFWTQNTASDFAQGTPDGNTDLDVSPGNILIAETLSTATDTAKNDFDYGRSENMDLTVVNSASGEVALSKTHSYNLRTSPALNSDSAYHSWLDTSSNLLYVSTYGGGLSVINTKGTTTTADDTLAITYGVSSNPAIASNDIMSSWLDTSSSLLYVNAYGGGLSVIDTKGTVTTTDDTLWKNYKTNTTPAIRSNNVWHSWFATSSNLLYVGTYGGGLSVIDTKGTVTTTDDTLTFTYSTTSNPAIVNDKVDHSWLDTSSNLLYVSTYGGGLSVIDTKGTVTTTDDTLWKNYKSNTTPAIADNLVSMSWLDTTFNLLYVSTNSGLSVIDTKGTVTTTDDTLAITYNFSSSPAIADNSVAHFWLDTTSNLLYVSAYTGLSVIDTKGTATTTDDTVAATYSDNSSQGMVGNTVESSWMDTATNYLYVSTFHNGLSVIKPDYNSSGTYLSHVINTVSTSVRVISWQATTSTDTAVAIQTRSGASSSYWIDDFNDADNSNVSDLQAWGTPFNILSAEGGILTMSDPESNEYAYMWVDTGQTFPAGSIIRGKFKVNTSASGLFNYIFTDDWSDVSLSYDYSSNNNWVYFSMVTAMPVSSIGFGPSWSSGTWQPEDTFQIDWISVESPDGWSDWSSSYTNLYGSEITSDLDQPNLQYRAVLSTGDITETPTLNSVTIASGYQATSTYTSAIFDTGTLGANFNTLSWTSTEPSGTVITFKARSGEQSNLSDATSFAALDQVIASGVTNLDGLDGVANGDRYFQFQAVLSTNSSSTSPTLSSTSLSYQPTLPTITSISSDKLDGTYGAGEVIDIDVTFSEAVTSTGNITITLETGTTDRTCTFSVTNATTGTCNYIVQAGDASLNLNATATGTIVDIYGGQMTNFTPVTGLSDSKALVIDAVAPTITSISSNKTNGTYGADEAIDIDVTFSEAVTSTGNIIVILETGATDRVCTFSVTNATTGTCNYTVHAGDVSSDLNATVTGTISDITGNVMSNFTPVTGLSANKALVISAAVLSSGVGGGSSYVPVVTIAPTSTPPATSTIPTNPVTNPSTPDASCPTIISGDMVKVIGKPAIYAVNKYLQTIYFPSGDEFKSWRPTYGGYKSITQVCFDSLNVPTSYPAAVNYRPGSYIVKRPSSDQLYVIEPNNTLSKISSTTAKSLYSASAYTGGTGYKIMTIADPFWPHYINRASDITSIKVHPGMLIKTNNIIYYIDDNNQLREVTDAGFTANQFQQRFVRVVPTSAIQGLTIGDKITSEIKTITDKTQSGE